MEPNYVLGIDFGTTNSVCAILSGDDAEVLENSDGNRKTPSVVYYTKDEEQNRPLIGQTAENKAQEDPERVIRSIKRQMGDADTIDVHEEEYRVERVAADILRKIRSDAAEKLDVDRSELTDAVITTPAYWESDRSQAVMQAADVAGFKSIRTIKEPAAAAIAYGKFKSNLDKTIGVYDLGGGTFDFAIVHANVSATGLESEYEVIAQSGDPELGGDDWDQRIVEWLVSKFTDEHGVNPLNEHHEDEGKYDYLIREERIRSNAREAKEQLSSSSCTHVDITIPFLMSVNGESVSIDEKLTQSNFENMTKELLDRTKEPMYTALNDAGLSAPELDDVILVGGSTRMEQVSELVRSTFNMKPKQRINQDEAVAVGAAVKGNKEDILLLEVTPLSLGIGIKGGKFKRMIDRNESLPASHTEVFSTSTEGATAVRIPIYQGERDVAKENRHLKTLLIQNMTPGKRNSAQIEVTFEVKKNGLINVRAVENTQNKSVEVELEDENELSDEFVNEKIKEAREMEELDKKRRKIIEAQNEAEEAITEAERLLTEFNHVFKDEEIEHVKKHTANVRNVRQNDTATLKELKQATDDLNEWVVEIGDRARRTNATANAGPTEGPSVETQPVEQTQATDKGVQTESPDSTVSSNDAGDAESWGNDVATNESDSDVEGYNEVDSGDIDESVDIDDIDESQFVEEEPDGSDDIAGLDDVTGESVESGIEGSVEDGDSDSSSGEFVTSDTETDDVSDGSTTELDMSDESIIPDEQSGSDSEDDSFDESDELSNEMNSSSNVDEEEILHDVEEDVGVAGESSDSSNKGEWTDEDSIESNEESGITKKSDDGESSDDSGEVGIDTDMGEFATQDEGVDDSDGSSGKEIDESFNVEESTTGEEANMGKNEEDNTSDETKVEDLVDDSPIESSSDTGDEDEEKERDVDEEQQDIYDLTD